MRRIATLFALTLTFMLLGTAPVLAVVNMHG